MRVPRVVLRPLVAVVAVLLALGGAELALRSCGVRQPSYRATTVQLLEGDTAWLVPGGGLLVRPSRAPGLEELRGEFLPNITFQWCYDVTGGARRPYMDERGCVTARVNADGLRGPLLARDKPERTLRVAAVGDSFTFGHGVPFEATWVHLLEVGLGERLAQRVPALRCQALDLGVPGFDARDCALYLRHKALAYDPDLVIYGFFLNDVFVGSGGGADARVLALRKRLYTRPLGLAGHSRLLELLVKEAARIELETLTREGYRAAFREDSPHWSACREILRGMKTSCDQAGVAFVVAIQPELVSLDDYPFEEAHARVAALCASLGVASVDLLDAVRGRSAPELWVHPTDHHPNERAHRLFARRLLPEVLAALDARR